MKLIPILNRVIVRPKALVPKANPSGILVVESAKSGVAEEGVVVAVGPGKLHPRTGERIPMVTSVGDTIIFSRISATVINVVGQQFLSILEDDIVGRLVADENVSI
jgi:co-chaperonin GroES (HSP10)